jgi:hypothetical protein
MPAENIGCHVSKRYMVILALCLCIACTAMLGWNSPSLASFSGNKADHERADRVKAATLDLERVVAGLGLSLRPSRVELNESLHIDHNIKSATLHLEQAIAELGSALIAHQNRLNESIHQLMLCNESKFHVTDTMTPRELPSKTLSQALQAAATELSGQNPGSIQLLKKASEIDRRLTPRESRGRVLTEGTFWAVLSCNNDPMYAFSIPIVALAWSKIVRARPLVLLIGAEFRIDFARTSQNSWIPLFLQTLQDFSIESVVLDSEDFASKHFSQVSRLFAFKLQVHCL